MTEQRVREFVEHCDGDVYVSFSGGKDSTVLLDICRKIYPNIKAVFCDTGLEYPEIKQFVNSIDNITIIKPDISFKKVIQEYGYPVISKEVARNVRLAKKIGTRTGDFYMKKFNGELFYNGKKSDYNCEKYKYLLNAPFKMSEQCCDVMKKKPFKNYEKNTKTYAIVGTMASESRLRKSRYLKMVVIRLREEKYHNQ